MYATPGEVQGEVEDISVPQVSPEVQEYEAQRKVYEESYTQIVNYLMQMGYSAEEAQAAAPSLLGQVSVESPTAPEGYGQSKAASYVFKTAEEKLTSRYISQGYSPQQARQLALEYVIPESEKYASLPARLLGAGIGGLGGAMAGNAAYDEDGEFRGALAGGALGALAGGLVPGMRSRYSGAALLDAARRGTRSSEGLNKARVDILKNTKLTRRERLDANFLTGSAFEDIARAEAAANRVADAQKVLAGAVPAYIAHRYLANSGGDNIVDKSFDAAGTTGEALVDKSTDLLGMGRSYLDEGIQLAKDNPQLAMLAGAGVAGGVGGLYLSDLEDKLESAKNRGSRRTKKAEVEKVANLGRLLKGAPLGNARAALYGSGLGAAQSSLSYDPNDPNDNIAKALGRGALFGGAAGLAGNKLLGSKALLGMAAVPAGTAAYQAGSGAFNYLEREGYRSDLESQLALPGGATEEDLAYYINRRKRVDDPRFLAGAMDFLADASSGAADPFVAAGKAIGRTYDSAGKALGRTYDSYFGSESKPAQSGSSFSLSDLPSFSSLYEKANLPSLDSLKEQGSNVLSTLGDRPYLTAGAGLGTLLGGAYLYNRMNSPAEKDPRDKLRALQLKNRAMSGRRKQAEFAIQESSSPKYKVVGSVGFPAPATVPSIASNMHQEALAKKQLEELESPSLFSRAKSYLGDTAEGARGYLADDVNRKRLLVGAGAGALLATGAAGLSGASRARQTLRKAGLGEHEIDRVVTPLGGAARSLGKSTLGAGAGGALGFGLGRGINALLGEEAKIEGLDNILGGVGALGGLGYGAYSAYQGERDLADRAIAERKYRNLLARSRRKKK